MKFIRWFLGRVILLLNFVFSLVVWNVLKKNKAK